MITTDADGALVVDPQIDGSFDRADRAEVFRRSTGLSATAISAVAVFAVLNGALIQIVMAARVLYGLGGQHGFMRAFASVNTRTRTPLLATAVATLIVLLLATVFRLGFLAEMTSLVVLSIFTLTNLALVLIKRRATPAPDGITIVPLWVPLTGAIVSGAFILVEIHHRLGF